MENSDPKNSETVLNPSAVYPPYAWPPPYAYAPEEEINLLDCWKVICKRLVFIFIFCFLCILAALFYVQYTAKTYKVQATLAPLSSSSGGGLSGLASQLGSLPFVGGQLGGLAGGVSKGGQLINIMKSRSFLEKVIHDFDLLKVLFPKAWEKSGDAKKPNLEAAFTELQTKLLSVEEDKKTSLVNISLQMEDPVLATAIVNRMIFELQETLNSKELTDARHNRVFIEGQLQKSKIELLELGKKLNQFYGSGRVSSISPQVDVDIGKMPDSSSKSFEELQVDLQGLEGQKKDLEAKMQDNEKEGIVHNVPSQIYLQYLTLQRELLGRVYGLLSQQYEMAKVEEAKNDLRFQVIDPAYPPVKYDKPQKVIVLGVSAVGSFFLAIFLAFFLEFVGRQKEEVRSEK
ncbi:MAG: hypothetical protein HQM15_03760 [Deltaproteobacteria bacterium]|nr:hypothetical protein [Deltaproteobacteria bacterium]